MANVAICMAMDMMYTVLLMRLGSNSLYRSTNCSVLQEGEKNDKREVKHEARLQMLWKSNTDVNSDVTCKECLVLTEQPKEAFTLKEIYSNPKSIIFKDRWWYLTTRATGQSLGMVNWIILWVVMYTTCKCYQDFLRFAAEFFCKDTWKSHSGSYMWW